MFVLSQIKKENIFLFKLHNLGRNALFFSRNAIYKNKKFFKKNQFIFHFSIILVNILYKAATKKFIIYIAKEQYLVYTDFINLILKGIVLL